MSECHAEAAGAGRYVLSGDLTYDTVPALWRAAEVPLAPDSNLVVDLARVGRSDSAGLALLMEWTREARRNNVAIRFVNVPEQMLSLAKVSSLEKILPIE